MSSPFASVEEINPVLLTYRIESGAIAIDPLTGIEYSTGTAEGVITAYVKNVAAETNPRSELALTPFAQKVKVYCITPMFLPKGLGEGTVFGYAFTEPTRTALGADAKVTRGKLTITQFRPAQISVVNEELGDMFYGYLALEGTD